MIDYSQTPASLSQMVLERNGCPLHYWLGGPGERPLIVLMHGATMDHRMFNAQVEAFSQSYRLLVWDARGHGRSQPIGSSFTLEGVARDMLAILDATDVDSAIIAGQSLGGYIAQHMVMMAPERLQAMIIIGSTPLAKAYSRWEVWALRASMPLFNLWPYKHFTKTLARNTAITQPVRDYALQACHQIQRRDFLTIWKAVTLAIDHKGLSDFSIPTPLLLCHGEYDKTGTIKRDMPLWAEMESQATYRVIPQAGHNANQDNPAFTNRIIAEFLREHVA